MYIDCFLVKVHRLLVDKVNELLIDKSTKIASRLKNKDCFFIRLKRLLLDKSA